MPSYHIINEREEPPKEDYRLPRRPRVSSDPKTPPPPKHLGRPFRTHTPLGQLMAESNLRVSQVVGICNIPYRIMSEYLAGRVLIRGDHLARLSEYFNIEPEDLQYQDEETVHSFSELVKKMGWKTGKKV